MLFAEILTFLVSLIIITLVITLHWSMYTWTDALEKEGCECSDMWHRKVINVFAVILLSIVILNVVMTLLKVDHQVLKYIKSMGGLIILFYYIFIIDYVRKLKDKECECSDDWKREYGYMFSVIMLVIIVIGLVFTSIGGLMTYELMKKKK